MNATPIPSVGVLVLKADHVLLVEHKESANHITGSKGLPSGKPETDESEEAAAARELREESGLIALAANLTKIKEYIAEVEGKQGLRLWRWSVYLCRSWTGELRESAETTPMWVPINELHKLKLLPNVLEAIEEGRKLL